MPICPLLPLALVALCLAGVASNIQADPLPLRSIAKGAVSGITEPRKDVIRDAESWEKFWGKHRAQAKDGAALPAVNFTNELVIAVTLGRKHTGGYTVEIVRAEPDDQHLLVTVRRTAPRPGALSLQVLTAPFHFVAVPRSALPVQFTEAKPAATP